MGTLCGELAKRKWGGCERGGGGGGVRQRGGYRRGKLKEREMTEEDRSLTDRAREERNGWEERISGEVQDSLKKS